MTAHPYGVADDYDPNPEPDPLDGWSERDLDRLADERAAEEYGGRA